MPRILLITVRFHDGRYHGTGDWPPSPARLFQALVAGVGQAGPLNDATSAPLEWLETLDPPVIAAPLMVETRAVTNYVPNNDLDAVGGDSRRIGSVRTAKTWKAKLFDSEETFLYAWNFDSSSDSEAYSQRICDFAERLYQLGRGIDQAWAVSEVIETKELDERLRQHRGVVLRPTKGRSGIILDCPMAGSLQSLKLRYAAMSQRFQIQGAGRTVKLQFAQAPKPRFLPCCYESPPYRKVFDLRTRDDKPSFVSWPLSGIGRLVVAVRDAAVARLKSAIPEQESQIEKCLVGRKANGDDDAPKAARVRILPLSSIGHEHADHAIRRILVEVPAQCLVRAEDVFWALSGLELPSNGRDSDFILVPATDESMLRHYGVGVRKFVRWRTITPAVLPESARRRRIEPARRIAEAKRGLERAGEQQQATAAIIQALRHAEIPVIVSTVRVQREPFQPNGLRAEEFAPGTRFPKESFWHVELVFTEPLTGPIIFGDGRFYGLGLMAPLQEREGEEVPA